jgi:hypothetical protein
VTLKVTNQTHHLKNYYYEQAYFKVIVTSLFADAINFVINRRHLQRFYVEHNDKPGFISTSIPKGNVHNAKLSENLLQLQFIDKISSSCLSMKKCT